MRKEIQFDLNSNINFSGLSENNFLNMFTIVFTLRRFEAAG
jgi:hypothetical protein